VSICEIVERPPGAVPRDQLGEAPFWDAAARRLYWVDIVGRRAQAFEPSTGAYRSWSLPGFVSALVPTETGDALAALPRGLDRLDLESGRTVPFAAPDADSSNRSNECRCDPEGNIWLGRMQNNLAPNGAPIPIDRASGGFWRIRPDGRAEKMLGDIGIANTLCWSPDGTRLYCADSMKGVLWSFAHDPDGPLSDRRVFVDEGPGGPDGSAMDEEGCLWTARWGGGCVIRYRPDGREDLRIELPVAQPSSCCFGGDDRKTLYVTSARQELENLPPDSLDGSLFAVRVGVAGLPLTRFRG
jgi:sugar lactone lactonase YvrE